MVEGEWWWRGSGGGGGVVMEGFGGLFGGCWGLGLFGCLRVKFGYVWGMG